MINLHLAKPGSEVWFSRWVRVTSGDASEDNESGPNFLHVPVNTAPPPPPPFAANEQKYVRVLSLKVE